MRIRPAQTDITSEVFKFVYVGDGHAQGILCYGVVIVQPQEFEHP
jgi:hypothetical protein